MHKTDTTWYYGCTISLQLIIDLLRHSFTVPVEHHLKLPSCLINSAVSFHLVYPYLVTLIFITKKCNGFAGRPIYILSGTSTLRNRRGEPVSASACCRAYPECSLAQWSLHEGCLHDCWFQQPECLFLCRQVSVAIPIASSETIKDSFA